MAREFGEGCKLGAEKKNYSNKYIRRKIDKMLESC